MWWLRKAMTIGLCMSVLSGTFLPFSARAEIDPNLLFSDVELEKPEAMSLTQIRTFLESKGVLGRYVFTDVDGVSKSAAEIIARIARDYRLNPKFLLALLQREQSLVEDPHPSQGQFDWAVGYARCDSCDTENPLVAAYRGFAQQLEGAANRIRDNYLNDLAVFGVTQTGWGPGVTKIVDGVAVTPANKATAILYTYTPHLHGNLNFARILKRWFTKEIPDGTVVKSVDGKQFWLISGGARRPFASQSAFLTRYTPNQAVVIPNAELDDYDTGLPIRFPNYSLLHQMDGRIWLLDGDTVRHIDSMEVFRSIGFSMDEVLDVADADLAGYTVGEPVTLASAYPTGALLQDKVSGAVYWVKDGKRAPILSKEILASNFPKRRITPVASGTLDAYPATVPVPFKDGTLIGIAGQRTVYVVSKGTRRPVASEVAFHAYGWSFKNVVWTSESAVNLHPLGAAVDVKAAPDLQSAGI